MTYVINSEIEERLGTSAYVQLTDDDGNGAANGGVVDEARLGAESEVNSYLARRYAVPINLTTHPELGAMLKSPTLDLVEYRLRARRPPLGEDIIRRRREAIEWLGRIADGTVELPSIAAPAANAAKGGIAGVASEKRVLSHDELSMF